MPTKEAKKKYDIQYAKDNLKRIPLNVRKEKYEEIKTAAAAAGEPVNGYIKRAIDERMEKEKVSPIAEPPIIHSVAEPESATTPKTKQEKHYKPFTKSDSAKLNMQELLTNIHYQMSIAETYGPNVFSDLVARAKQAESYNADSANKPSADNVTAAYNKNTDAAAPDAPAYETLDEKLARLHQNHPRPKPIQTEI